MPNPCCTYQLRDGLLGRGGVQHLQCRTAPHQKCEGLLAGQAYRTAPAWSRPRCRMLHDGCNKVLQECLALHARMGGGKGTGEGELQMAFKRKRKI